MSSVHFMQFNYFYVYGERDTIQKAEKPADKLLSPPQFSFIIPLSPPVCPPLLSPHHPLLKAHYWPTVSEGDRSTLTKRYAALIPFSLMKGNKRDDVCVGLPLRIGLCGSYDVVPMDSY